MIRDPSDGSVKTSASVPAVPAQSRPGSDQNWGLKSLDREARKPKPAPTKEELAAHYREYGLGFRRKETIE